MSGQQNSSEAAAGVSGNFALKDVYGLLRKEIESDSLQAIAPDTFQKIATALGSLKGQGYEGIEAQVRDRMVDLLATSARLLMESRLHKMRSPGERLDYSKLTDEEKYVLDGRRESESRAAEVIAATVKGRVKVLESISVKVRSRQIVVRFLLPMESFVRVDANKYGPFQREDIASLPFENARSIIEGGIAVEIHVQT
jgi:DNA replication factor GINS